jgi:hypothetical protein
MAIGIGNTSGNASQWSVPGSPPFELSWSHTVGSNSNRILVVAAYGRANSGSSQLYSGDEITYGSSLLTFGAHLHYEQTGFEVACDIWYLLNPPSGTDTVTIRWTEDNYPGDQVQNGNGCAIDIYNAEQQAPEASNTVSYGAGGVFSDMDINITTVTAGALVIRATGIDGSQTVSSYQDTQTSFFNVNYSNLLGASAAYNIQGAAGVYGMDMTLSGSALRGTNAVVAFAEAGAGGGSGVNVNWWGAHL